MTRPTTAERETMAVYDEDEDYAPVERDYGIYVAMEQAVIRKERKDAAKRARAAEAAKWAEKLWDEICARSRRAA
jgi:hydroxymethylpyrimidine pyrophosphatase-like HAD family hydrolase